LIVYFQAKNEAHISDTQAKRWQRLAKVPQDQFEQRLQDHTARISTAGLIGEQKPERAIPSRAPVASLATYLCRAMVR